MSSSITTSSPTSVTSKPWYESWFASEYYLKLYGHRNRVEAEACIDIIQRATQLHPDEDSPCKALDVACGPGRHAMALAKRNFEVTAVDLSDTLLKHAKAAAQKSKVDIRFLNVDMRSLDFKADFDLAVQLFSSFGYFAKPEHEMNVLAGVRRSLRDIGYYALDLMNPSVLRRTLVPKSVRIIDDLKITEEREIEDGFVTKKITIPSDDGKQVYEEKVRLYEPDHIERMLRETGFLPTHWYGDYSGTPYDRDRSKRMIVISKVA